MQFSFLSKGVVPLSSGFVYPESTRSCEGDLKRIDTTLNLSQKAKVLMLYFAGTKRPVGSSNDWDLLY